MSAKLPFDAALGTISVTQLEHVSVDGVPYPAQLYYSYDFDLPLGSNVLSIADGVVVSAVNDVPDGATMAPAGSGLDAVAYPQLGPGGTGNQVTVRYEALGLHVTYAHLSVGSIPFIEAEIAAGTATVSQGDVLGQTGRTGTGTAPHLHITYGTSLTGWGGSTSSVYPTTMIADGSTANNPAGFALLFDEANGLTLTSGSYQSENVATAGKQADPYIVGAYDEILVFDGTGFDATRVQDATVVTEDGTTYLYYSGEPFNNHLSVGLATSVDGTTFTRFSDEALIDYAGSTWFSDFRILPSKVIVENGLWTMYFWGNNRNLSTDQGARGFGIATSTDGVTWTLASEPLLVEEGPSEGYTLIDVVTVGGQTIAYVTDLNSSGDRRVPSISTSTDGTSFSPPTVAPWDADHTIRAAVEYTGGVIGVFNTPDPTAFQVGFSTDGTTFTRGSTFLIDASRTIEELIVEGDTIVVYASKSVGNVNWNFGNRIIERFEIPLDLAEATPVSPQANGFKIEIDYSLDSGGFFNEPARRAVMEEAARIWRDLIGDEFANVQPGTEFSVRDPSNPSARVQIALTESIDDLRIYVGSNDLGGFRPSENGSSVITGGDGGPDGYDAAGDILRSRIYPEFRGTPTTDFEPFVGTISFNSNPEAVYSTSLVGPEAGKIDLLSTALHEIGHVLGFGSSGPFENQVNNGALSGPNTLATNGGQPIPLESDGSHIADGFAGNTVLMDPLNFIGIRRLPSEYDLAILADIGYEIAGYSKEGALPAIVTAGDDITVFGTTAADLIDGLAGNDQIQGNQGNDTLIGGEGEDTIFGQEGDDTLAGGPDNDMLIGGEGTDIYRFDGPVGQDVIGDFDYASEVIEVSTGYGFASIDDVLAAQSRPFSNATALTFAPGQSVTIIDNPTGNALKTGNIRLTSGGEFGAPTPPTPALLEYFARDIAYIGGSVDAVFDINAPVSDALANPTGYKIDAAFVLPLGFVAVGLSSNDPSSPVEPVLAIRGSNSGVDWLLANTDPSGIGYNQALEAWEDDVFSLRSWIEEKSPDGLHIVGHSLGGAQAQLLSAWATGTGTEIASLTTFNSPGISAAVLANNLDPSLLGEVTHNISSGDIVSMAGEDYIDGTVNLYDFDSFDPFVPLLNVYSHFLNSHTGHWADQSLYNSVYDNDASNGPAGLGPAGPLPQFGSSVTILASSELDDSNYSYLDVGGYFDIEYMGALYYIALAGNFLGAGLAAAGVPALLGGNPLLGSSLAYSLSTRDGTEALRQNVGVVERLLETLAINLQEAVAATWNTFLQGWDTIVSWTNSVLSTVGNWAVEQWEGISDWTVEIWQVAKSLPEAFWTALSEWTHERWVEVNQWADETWEKLTNFSDAAWQATVDGTAALLRKIGEFPDEMAALADNAWMAMKDWTGEQWAAVSDWTSQNWNEAKDFTAAVWEDTKTKAKAHFDNIKGETAVVVNKVYEELNRATEQIGEIRSDAVEDLRNILNFREGFGFFRDNPNVEVISPENGFATANSTAPGILVSSGNGSETLTGSEQNDMFFPSANGILQLFNPSPAPVQPFTVSFAETTFTAPETGADIIVGTVETLDGVRVSGFGTDDTILVSRSVLAPEKITVTTGSAVLSFDGDGDGAADSTLTLEGEYGGLSFEVSSVGGSTTIRLARPEASHLSAAGERFITVDPGANRVYGDDGDDVAVTGAGDDFVSAGAGSDVVVAGAGMDTLLGGLGADNLTGGADADLFAFSASDFGPGFTADFITDFTPGEDVIELSGLGFTDLASLSFVTVAEGDAIDFGSGRFIVLEGLTAADLSDGDIVGAEFALTYGLVSTTAVHRLTDAEDRFISTDTGPSEIIGRAGADAIVGGAGDDTIRGEEGADVLIGGAGADVLIGGAGADQMTGLSGADEFVFTSGEETGFVAEFVTDYELGVDTLTLLNFGFTSAEDLTFTTAGSGDVSLQLAPTRFVVFEGYQDQTVLEIEAENWGIA